MRRSQPSYSYPDLSRVQKCVIAYRLTNTISSTKLCSTFVKQSLECRLFNLNSSTDLIFSDNGIIHRSFSRKVSDIVLGIETSCDDTGCAIVDNNGTVLGEALKSQQQIHIKYGGIIPPIARDLHLQNIKTVVEDALEKAKIQISDVDAIATTVKPGLPLSLLVGLNYGKSLSSKFRKPFIPIHHMEAHALTVRMVQKVDFPFLVLLISGGHCLLAIAKSIDKFLLLGQSLDDAPGEAFDKAARRLKLRNLPEFRNLSGGQAIELAASKSTNPGAFTFPTILAHCRDCNFSVAGLKNKLRKHIITQEEIHGVEGDELIPDVFNLCADFQMAITRHICQRLQRGMEFIALRNLLPEESKTLVVSGGVACNGFIKRALDLVCQDMGYLLAVPPPNLCTDNGIMIAWNGMERWKAQIGIAEDLDSVDIDSKSPFGDNWTEEVTKANIKCKWIKLRSLYDPQIENRQKREAAICDT
ncbi:putative tRNA N6-adenosine threonylcarbamoyltransferase [Blattella germanica]|nr:putative tRNA N6-adenosine threonylcarbamoyltransferase [Blattella germanica]